jgi:hypothetical protein
MQTPLPRRERRAVPAMNFPTRLPFLMRDRYPNMVLGLSIIFEHEREAQALTDLPTCANYICLSSGRDGYASVPRSAHMPLRFAPDLSFLFEMNPPRSANQ